MSRWRMRKERVGRGSGFLIMGRACVHVYRGLEKRGWGGGSGLLIIGRVV